MSKKETNRCMACFKLYYYKPPEGDPFTCPYCGNKQPNELETESEMGIWEYGQEGRCGGCNMFRGNGHLDNCTLHICREHKCKRMHCPCGSIKPPESGDPATTGSHIEPDDDEIQDPLHKIARDIIKRRHEILKHFTEAYLAENMKDTPIRDLVLHEKQKEPTHPMEMQGFTYWFEVGDHNKKHPSPESNPNLIRDMIHHPTHYQGKGMEAIDVIDAFEMGFNLGNAIKYLLRCGKKGSAIEDLQKAKWYLDREIAKWEPELPY